MGLINSIKGLFGCSEEQLKKKREREEREAEYIKLEEELRRKRKEREKVDPTRTLDTQKVYEKIKKDPSVVPEEIEKLCKEARGKKSPMLFARQSLLDQWTKNEESKKNIEEAKSKITAIKNSAMEAERENIDKAIEIYKESIANGEDSELDIFDAYSYSYERLFVLLRKQKRTDEEKQYLEAYLKHDISDSNRQKYNERLTSLTWKSDK